MIQAPYKWIVLNGAASCVLDCQHKRHARPFEWVLRILWDPGYLYICRECAGPGYGGPPQ